MVAVSTIIYNMINMMYDFYNNMMRRPNNDNNYYLYNKL